MIYVVKWGEHLLNGNVLSGNLITNILYFRDVIDVLRGIIGKRIIIISIVI